MTYYIDHNQYFNEIGVPSAPYFRVYHMRRFLGLIPYRKFAEETHCGMGDCYSSPINFKSEELAETFIKEVLCAGIKTETTQRNIVKEIKCN
jgi:hypothetical protein